MAGLAAAAGAGDFGFPVGGFFVEAAQESAPLGDACPGLCRAWRMRHTAAVGERNSATVGRFALAHAEAAGLLRGRVRVVHGLGMSGVRKAPQAEESQKEDGPASHAEHPSTVMFGCVNQGSRLDLHGPI